MPNYLVTTGDDDDDVPSRKKFDGFKKREASRLCRELGVPLDILDRMEEFNQVNGLSSEKFCNAVEAGNPIALEINEQMMRNRGLATEGLLIQQSLSDLGRIQAEQDQYTSILSHNQALVAENKRLKAMQCSYVIALTQEQIFRWIPYFGIAALLIVVGILFRNQNVSNSSSPNSPAVVSPVQSPN